MPKTALITGASSGVGAASARLFAENGYRVVLVARNEARLTEITGEIGTAATFISCDASDGGAVAAMAQQVKDEIGIPDVIINSAGLGEWKRIEDTSPEEALKMIGAPYLAAFNVTQIFMKNMLARNSGVIIHVNSPGCYMPWPSAVGYTGSRFALRGLHEALCQDLAGTGIKSVHVIFGRIDSEYFETNPSAARHMPGIASTIPTLSVETCAKKLLKAVDQPGRQHVYPFMLRLYHWINLVFPWLVRWLLRITAPRDVASKSEVTSHLNAK